MPRAVRVLMLCVSMALAVPLAAVALGASARDVLTSPVLARALAYSISIGVPSALLLPVIASRVGHPGTRLALTTAAAIVVLAAVGCLAGGLVLVALGYQTLAETWRTFPDYVRLTSAMALVCGMGAYFYEKMASELRETKMRFEHEELEKERARKLALEARLSSLESRIQPHFLFNTLNSISALIPVEPERAEQMVGRLAKLLRSSLDATRTPLIPLDAELEMVQAYLEIEKARFGARLEYAFSIEPGALSRKVPPMAVQSLVENAVKHGIARQPEGGRLQVAAMAEPGVLVIEVRDNGPGFDLAGVTPGHGLEILVSRLEALYGPAGQLEVARVNGECVVTMVLPEPA